LVLVRIAELNVGSVEEKKKTSTGRLELPTSRLLIVLAQSNKSTEEAKETIQNRNQNSTKVQKPDTKDQNNSTKEEQTETEKTNREDRLTQSN
jgi:hypothetical protein